MQYPWFKQIHTSKNFSNSLNTIVNNKKMTMGPQTTKVENYLKKLLPRVMEEGLLHSQAV